VKKQNFSAKIKRFVDFYDQSVKAQNFSQLIELFPQIDPIEYEFLNSYDNRKKDGTFYTDRELAEFIVKEMLVCYINKKLVISNQKIRKIEELNEIYDYNQNIKQKIEDILLNLTICDPACGSGIFLLSSAEIIYKSLIKLNHTLSDILTKERILNNIYGFDINNLAIKLCTLKLLKWYVPNFHPKIEKITLILRSNLKLQNSILNSHYNKFDIIISNPPYGNILNRKQKEILKTKKAFYKDIYCLFLEEAIKWSNELIGFLIPKSFLLRQGYIKFRNDFLAKVNILKIYDVGSNIFEKATNEVQIILYENKINSFAKDLEVFNYPKNKIITYQNQNVDSLRICFNSNCPLNVKAKKLYVYSFSNYCPYCGCETVSINRIRIKPNKFIYDLLEKIEKVGDMNYLNPIDFPNMIRGEEKQGLKLVKKILRNDTNGSCFFINARNDFDYYFFKKEKSFNIEEIDSNILKGNNYQYYVRPKLLIKHNNIIPQALYTKESVCFTSSVYSMLYDNRKVLKFLCALLNSSLMQFYCIFAINNQKDTTINLNQYMIRHLPIKEPSDEVLSEIVEIVDQIDILFEKFAGMPNEKALKLLRTLDQIIFKLYSITKKEESLIISKLKDQVTFYNRIYKNRTQMII
jgi:hypothetical protein